MHWVLWNMSIISSYSRMSDEARLLRHLFDQYEKMGTSSRPTYNSSAPTAVHFGIRLIQLDVDEKNQLLKTSAWLRMVSFPFLNFWRHQWATDTHVLDFCWCLFWASKSEWASRRQACHIFSDIHLWCHTCWLLGRQPAHFGGARNFDLLCRRCNRRSTNLAMSLSYFPIESTYQVIWSESIPLDCP